MLWGIIIGAEAPDFDFVIRLLGGPVKYLKLHRGPSHGLITLPFQAALISAVIRLFAPEVAFAPLFWWTLAGLLSHVIFDFGNDYGTQGLWPFSRRWIALDIIPIVDVWILGAIGAGWLIHGLWPGHRLLVFAGVWLLIALYVLYRWWMRQQAWHLVASHFNLEEPCGESISCGSGWKGERLSIHPTLLSLSAWRYVVQARGEYLLGMVRLRERKVTEPVRAKNQQDRIVMASLKSQVVSVFADWVRRPRVTVEQADGLYHVQWFEARYEVDGYTPFSAYAWLDERLTLVDEGLGKQAPEKRDAETVKRRLRKEMGREE